MLMNNRIPKGKKEFDVIVMYVLSVIMGVSLGLFMTLILISAL